MPALRALLVSMGALCLLLVSSRAPGALPEALQIVASDAELGQRIARSVRQEQKGPVTFVPRATAGRPSARTLRLEFDQAGDRLLLALSLGRALKVERAIHVAGNRLDVAEAVAICMIEMRARLDDLQARRAAARSAPLPAPAPQQQPAGPAASLQAVVSQQRTPETPTPAAAEPAQHRAIPPPEALQVPVVLQGPVPPPARPPLRAPDRRTPDLGSRRSPWMLAAGVPLALAGGAALGLGAASIAVNGQCIDSAVPCAYRFDSLGTGIGEVVAGAVVLAAGTGLLAIDLFRLHRRLRAARRAAEEPLHARP